MIKFTDSLPNVESEKGLIFFRFHNLFSVNMFARAPLSRACSFFPKQYTINPSCTSVVIQTMGAKTQANTLKRGDLINLKNRVLEVLKTGFCKTGARGTAYTQLELRDIQTGKKKEERVRTDEIVEMYQTEAKEATFLSMELSGKVKAGKPEGSVTFELDDEPEGEDEITIPADQLPWPATYYADCMCDMQCQKIFLLIFSVS